MRIPHEENSHETSDRPFNLDRFLEEINVFSQSQAVLNFNKSTFVKQSISENPFSKEALQNLKEKLQSRQDRFEQQWILEEHLLWAKASFQKKSVCVKFEQLLSKPLQDLKKNFTPELKNKNNIQIDINFHGTNNKIHTKNNTNDHVINELFSNFKIQVPGVGSSDSLTGDPVGLFEVEMHKHRNDKDHPFKDLFKMLKPTWYVRLARFLFPGFVQKWRIRHGNGCFYAAIYAATKIYEIRRRYPNQPLQLNVFGHSRGSISALILNFVLDAMEMNNITVNQSLNDPVPGGVLEKAKARQQMLKDGAYKKFQHAFKHFGLNNSYLVEALINTPQPKLVKKSLLNYPVGDTRLMFTPLTKIKFHPETHSTIVLCPGGHNDPVYGRYPLGLLSIGLTEKTGVVARNLSNIPEKLQRDNVARFYKNLLSLHTQYGRSNTQDVFHEWLAKQRETAIFLIEAYARFMVHGLPAYLMTDSYAILQTNQSRTPELLDNTALPQYFMDNFHEQLFSQLWPDVYHSIRTEPKQSKEVIQTTNDLPLSMKRILLHKLNKESMESKPPKTFPKTIDSLIPINYFIEGLFGRKHRKNKLFLREPYAHAMKRISLKERYRENSTITKPKSLLRKLPIKDLKYLNSVYNAQEILKYKKDILERQQEKLPVFEKKRLEKTLELIEILEYYAKKNAATGGEVPTPLYIFLQKCPDLFQIYCDSPLRKFWYCPKLDELSTLENQIAQLNHYEINNPEEQIDFQSLQLLITTSYHYPR